jgi:hypothetical protein
LGWSSSCYPQGVTRELEIRVLRRPEGTAPHPAGTEVPSFVVQPPTQAPGHSHGGSSAASPVGILVRGGLSARVREALRCPYCREALTAEEIQSAQAEQAPRSTNHTSPLGYSSATDVAGLLGVSGLAFGLRAYGSLPRMGAIFAVVFVLAPLVFLGLRNGAAALVSYLSRYMGLGELIEEAKGLWNDKPDHATSHGGSILGCARRGCGALYHAECWEECSQSYGACAVFACGSKQARGISQTQLRLRGLRMLVAAFLFPPKVIQAVRSSDSDEVKGEVARIRAAIGAQARAAHGNMWSSLGRQRDMPWRSALNWLQMGTVLGSAMIGFMLSVVFVLGRPDPGLPGVVTAMLLVTGLPALSVLALYTSSWGVALAIFGAKSILSGEFAALSRLGEGGAYLTRASAKKGK